MKMLAILTALGLAACSSSAGTVGGTPDAPGFSDANGGSACSVAIELPTQEPQVGVDTSIRATASVENVTGTLTYDWIVTLDGVTAAQTPAAMDNSSITIPITAAGTIHIVLSLDGQPQCNAPTGDIVVLPTTFATASYRLRVVPPAAAGVPATDEIVQVHGGVDTIVPVGLSLGVSFANGFVVDGGGLGVPAYVRMTPVGAPTAIVEAYADATGALPTLTVLGQMHSALVVPTSSALAPALLAWTPGTSTTFAVSAGTVVTGVVHDPSGAGLGSASVALTIDGTPSSVGVTSATGAFTLHATAVTGATIAIAVTPPTASGLPRLVASSTTIALDSPWTVNYAAALATRDVSSVHVTRTGSPVASASFAIVGTIASAGTISAGAVNVAASGDTHVVGTTTAAGILTGRAPAAPLSLVVTRSGTDVALASFDLSAAAPGSVATAAPVAVTGNIGTPGVQVAATGSGALAGVVVQTVSDSSGAFSLPLAAGGAYSVQLYDPAGRGAPLVQTIASATASNLGTLALPTAVHLIGTISVSGASVSLAGTAVQLLCVACTGVGATTPIAEGAADANGHFSLAVPDPDAGSAR